MVTLRARNDSLENLTYYWPAEIVERGASESLIRVTFPGKEVALFQALAWAEMATLVEPAALCEEIVRRARLALQRYDLR